MDVSRIITFLLITQAAASMISYRSNRFVDHLGHPINGSYILKSRSAATKSTLDGVANFTIPFVGSLQVRTNHGYKHLCGVVIVDESFVITTAHCFHKHRNPWELSIVVGSNQLSISKYAPHRHQVQLIMPNEYYLETNPLQGRDIAIVKVKQKFKFDHKRIDKVNYKSNEYVKNDVNGYLIGWGKGKSEQPLELVSFSTITNQRCIKKRRFIYISHTELCAISYKGRGGCDGDSGGPLVNTDFNLVYGLLSYGRKPCKRNKVYAFERTSIFVQWITDKINMYRNA